MQNPLIEELRWVRFPVLDDGFVCLVDVMGDDSSVVQAARVSYGKDERYHRDEEDVVKAHKEDRNLIRYMMSGGYQMKCPHGTPFEMAEVKLLVRCPMDVWRQWIRHRTANVNEYSTRYSEAIDSQQKTPPDQWRLQSSSNKQGSSGLLKDREARPVQYSDGHKMQVDSHTGWEDARELTELEKEFHDHARRLYQYRLDYGVAREQARKDLPLSTYTEAYWKCDLRNILHFLGLRMDSHAQQEIRQYATIIGEQIIAPLFPLVWEAFQDYQLGTVVLSRQEVLAIQQTLQNGCLKVEELMALFPNRREYEACCSKLEKLGFASDDE